MMCFSWGMKMKELNRTVQREKVMQSIYQILLFLDEKMDYDATSIILSVFDVNDVDEIPKYALQVYIEALKNFNDIKKIISDHLVTWTYERVNPLCKAILFLSLSEGIYVKTTPRNVIINEAVNLAKKYLDSKEYRFINSLLDKVL